MSTNVMQIETKKNADLNFNFDGLNEVPTKKVVSELSQLTQTINKDVEGSVRSVSSYFKEFRKKGSELTAKMKLYNVKGRTFNPELCHKILNCGDIKPIYEGSDRYEDARRAKLLSEGKEYKPFSGVWSANRLQTVFFFVVETTPKK